MVINSKHQVYHFPQQLKEARKKAGISQIELGGAIGVSVTSIYFYEIGKFYPRMGVMLKIFDFFKQHKISFRVS